MNYFVNSINVTNKIVQFGHIIYIDAAVSLFFFFGKMLMKNEKNKTKKQNKRV